MGKRATALGDRRYRRRTEERRREQHRLIARVRALGLLRLFPELPCLIEPAPLDRIQSSVPGGVLSPALALALSGGLAVTRRARGSVLPLAICISAARLRGCLHHQIAASAGSSPARPAHACECNCVATARQFGIHPYLHHHANRYVKQPAQLRVCHAAASRQAAEGWPKRHMHDVPIGSSAEATAAIWLAPTSP